MKTRRAATAVGCCSKPSLKERSLLTPIQAGGLASVFKVLANDTRLRLLHALVRADELCVTDLAASLGMKPQAVSNQLQRLSDLGILASRREGNSIHYRLVDLCVRSLLDQGLCLVEEGSERSRGRGRNCCDWGDEGMRRLGAEVLGTFALVFAGTGAVVINDVTGGTVTHVGVAWTFGLVVLAMVYAVGDVSGAHLNPAVTLGFVAARRLEAKAIVPYIVSQIAGALLASLLLRGLFPGDQSLGATVPAGWSFQSFVLEAVLTFILMFVILCVSTGAKEKGLIAGAAIGAVVGLEAMFAGPISGASMNPARSLAPAIVSGHFQSLWVYLAGPIF